MDSRAAATASEAVACAGSLAAVADVALAVVASADTAAAVVDRAVAAEEAVADANFFRMGRVLPPKRRAAISKPGVHA